MSRATA